jgi:hypothetical protein
MTCEIKEKIKLILEQNNRILMEQIETVLLETSTSSSLPNRLVVLKDDKKLDMYPYRILCINNYRNEKNLTSMYTMYDEQYETGNPNPQVLYEQNMFGDPHKIWSLLSLKLRVKKNACTNEDGGDYFSLNNLEEQDFLKMLDDMISKYNK